ncbi:MAG: PilZ domain-containing protein, partial [Nitrospiraceae bacterium]
LRFLMINPFRCQLCTHRFLAYRTKSGHESRREYERILVGYTVKFCPVSSGEQVEFSEGTMHNLSIRGCQIESSRPASRGAHLRLAFVAAEGELPIQVEAAVVRSTVGGRMGLEFLDMRPEHEDRLRRLIETRLMTRPSLDVT